MKGNVRFSSNNNKNITFWIDREKNERISRFASMITIIDGKSSGPTQPKLIFLCRWTVKRVFFSLALRISDFQVTKCLLFQFNRFLSLSIASVVKAVSSLEATNVLTSRLVATIRTTDMLNEYHSSRNDEHGWHSKSTFKQMDWRQISNFARKKTRILRKNTYRRWISGRWEELILRRNDI